MLIAPGDVFHLYVPEAGKKKFLIVVGFQPDPDNRVICMPINTRSRAHFRCGEITLRARTYHTFLQYNSYACSSVAWFFMRAELVSVGKLHSLTKEDWQRFKDAICTCRITTAKTKKLILGVAHFDEFCKSKTI